jgi:hypothetical protein
MRGHDELGSSRREVYAEQGQLVGHTEVAFGQFLPAGEVIQVTGADDGVVRAMVFTKVRTTETNNPDGRHEIEQWLSVRPSSEVVA